MQYLICIFSIFVLFEWIFLNYGNLLNSWFFVESLLFLEYTGHPSIQIEYNVSYNFFEY